MIDDEQQGPPCEIEMCASATVPPTFRGPNLHGRATLLAADGGAREPDSPGSWIRLVARCGTPAWHPIHGSGGHPRSRFAGQEPPITPAARFQKTSGEPHRRILAVVVISRVLAPAETSS